MRGKSWLSCMVEWFSMLYADRILSSSSFCPAKIKFCCSTETVYSFAIIDFSFLTINDNLTHSMKVWFVNTLCQKNTGWALSQIIRKPAWKTNPFRIRYSANGFPLSSSIPSKMMTTCWLVRILLVDSILALMTVSTVLDGWTSKVRSCPVMVFKRIRIFLDRVAKRDQINENNFVNWKFIIRENVCFSLYSTVTSWSKNQEH